MSGESTDSESFPSDTNQRSRSLFRHVRASISGKNCYRQNLNINYDSTTSPSSVLLLRKKRRSFEHIDLSKHRCKHSSGPPTPNSFFNQVRSHFIRTPKYRRTKPSFWIDEDDYHSIPSVISNLDNKSSPINDDNPIDLSSPELVDNAIFENGNERTMLINDSINSTVDDEGPKSINTSRLSLNKFKDQFTQRTKTIITKPPSLTSIFTNNTMTSSPPVIPDQVYWTEICIERGTDLAVKDLNGTSDPYVKVYYGTEEKYRSATISKTLNPVWNEKFTIFTDDLNIPLSFSIFDQDRVGRDEAMGTGKLDLWRLPFDQPYPATLELENEGRNDGKMGILKVNVMITPKSVEFRDEVIRTLAKQSLIRGNSRTGSANGVIVPRRTIDIFVIEGRNLLITGTNKTCSPYVRLKYGNNKKYRTQTIKSTTNPQWHQSFMFDTTASELCPLELTVIDDTNSSGEMIGRATCHLAHLDEERTHRIPVELEDGAGIIDLFVTITITTALQEATSDGESSSQVALEYIPSRITEEDIQHYKFFSTIRTLQPIFDVGKVEIKIYQARDLSAKDITGKSDPFCIIELDSTRLRTHTLYKTLNPIWNKSFVIPVQDIHSILELTIYDEDNNKSSEFIGKIVIPLLAIKNGEKKWYTLKDRKCLLPVKGTIEIEATLIYTNLKAIIRTFNPRQTAYYQSDGKFSVGAVKQHVNRIQNMLKGVIQFIKFINDCFQWENPLISFLAFMASLMIVWNFELYMLPCTLLLIFARNAIIEYRRGRLGKSFSSLGDETISTVVQTVPIEEDILDAETVTKEQKKSFMGMIQSIQDTILEIQGYVDGVASTLERIKNLFNFTVPWLSTLLIAVLFILAIILYYIPLRYLILAFVINKFTKRFRKPKGYVDNNELVDFISRLPSDPELMQYRELKNLSRLPTPKKIKR